ncbi:MAG: heavy-metal-associated domain-containing protein [Aggregatilineales bacterium]
MESKTFSVPNIGCDGCVRTVQNEVSEVSGVKTVVANLDKQVVVEWDTPATWDAIKAKLVEIDYAPAE